MTHPHTECHQRAWLDKIAISMAAVCAVHCLLMPVLIVLLPIFATSFFVHKDFHLWMLFLVFPTTGMAIFMGCRKHKDKLVAILSAVGLSILILAVIHERTQFTQQSSVDSCSTVCAHCTGSVAGAPLHAGAWVNVLGGLFLACGHIRNYRLCRNARCQHKQ